MWEAMDFAASACALIASASLLPSALILFSKSSCRCTPAQRSSKSSSWCFCALPTFTAICCDVRLRAPFILYHTEAFAAIGSGISTLPVAGSMGPGAPKAFHLSDWLNVGVAYRGSGGGVTMMPGTREGSFAPDSSCSCWRRSLPPCARAAAFARYVWTLLIILFVAADIFAIVFAMMPWGGGSRLKLAPCVPCE